MGFDGTARMDKDGLVSVEAKTLLHGAVRVADERGGWVRPWRFSEGQVRTVGSCHAWHPGLYRQMARCTAGITLEFETDASEVTVEVLLDPEPSGTRSQLDVVDVASGRTTLPRVAPASAPSAIMRFAESSVLSKPGSPRASSRTGLTTVAAAGDAQDAHDGLSAMVDGARIAPHLTSYGEESVNFSLEGHDGDGGGCVVPLPGLGASHHVTVFLPSLRGCAIRRVYGNGSYIAPVEERPRLLVLGDSIAQGFVTDDPALAWPSLLARRLGLDVVNQGIGGQVFQPGTLVGLASLARPCAIVVALGHNYRFERCRDREVARDIRSYLLEVARVWQGVPTWVMTPTWHDEDRLASHAMSCWRDVSTIIAANVAVHDSMTLVDGTRMLDHRSGLLADGCDHPNAEGAAQIATRLSSVMRARQGDAAERRERAREILEAAGVWEAVGDSGARSPKVNAVRRAFPLVEALRRGVGEVVLAEPGCILLVVEGSRQMLWAPDHELGGSVVAAVCDPTVVNCLEPALVREVGATLGLDQVDPYHVCIWRSRTKAVGEASGGSRRQRQAHEVRTLDASYLSTVLERYQYPSYVSAEAVERRLSEGRFVGGFENGELVGFAGEHGEGSIGMLEVFGDHRREGWGRALLAAKVNQVLDRGETPWSEVYPHDRASVYLHRKLGFTIVPANETCFVSKG